MTTAARESCSPEIETLTARRGSRWKAAKLQFRVPGYRANPLAQALQELQLNIDPFAGRRAKRAYRIQFRRQKTLGLLDAIDGIAHAWRNREVILEPRGA